MSARCEVELDIFSGMPNPTWILSNDEAHSFVNQLAELPRTSARVLSGNLGYRGFIVQCAEGTHTQLIRIQHGTVHVSTTETDVYVHDEDRRLERWLLNTGSTHLKSELFQIAEREIR